MFVSCRPPTDGQLRAARRLRPLENGFANGATPVALETPQAARPPGTATAACQLLELVSRRERTSRMVQPILRPPVYVRLHVTNKDHLTSLLQGQAASQILQARRSSVFRRC